MKEKILTQEIVKELGLDKVSVITADMLEGYTGITSDAFADCKSLTSVTIPDSVMSIGWSAFDSCIRLKSIEIPDSVTSIGRYAFYNCTSLVSVTIPGGVTAIELGAFYGCNSLPSVTIGDKIYKQQIVTNGKCKAYKGFKSDMTCCDFQYKEGETYEFEGKPKLCERGFHACLNLADVFNYYWGKIDKDVVVHEVELEGVSAERLKFDSKVVAGKITIGKRIL